MCRLIIPFAFVIMLVLVETLLEHYGFLRLEGETWAEMLYIGLCMVTSTAIWTRGWTE